MILIATLTLLAQTAGEPFDVSSTSGAFRAEVRWTADERHPSREPRWWLTLMSLPEGRDPRALWRVAYEPRDHPVEHFLAEDGSAFVLLDPEYAVGRPLVVVWRKGRRAAAYDADELKLDPRVRGTLDDDARWIDVGPRTVRQRPIEYGLNASWLLDFLPHDRRLRTLDLQNGDLVTPESTRRELRVVPEVPHEIEAPLEPPQVDRWTAPTEGVAGQPIAMTVRGALPAPGWALVGFGVELDASVEGDPLLLVTPYVAELDGGPTALSITHFETQVELFVPEPGRYQLAFHAREIEDAIAPRRLDVAPGRLFVSMIESGGLTGARQEIVAHRDGRLEVDDRIELAPLEPFRELVTRVNALPPTSTEKLSVVGADLPRYELTWVSPDGHLVRAVLDEATLESPHREVVEALHQLARGGPTGPPVWTLDPRSSSFLVRTRSSGLFSAFGHDHTIAVRDFEGEIVVDPEEVDEGRLEIVVRARSLTLVNDDDRDEIEAEMRANVLEVDRHPEIRFRTTSVAAKTLSGGRVETVLTGELSLHGVKRRLRVSALLTFAGDELTATGRFDLRQKDFRITPPMAAAGTINVRNEVAIEFRIVARRP